jgi:hypothetical protein
VSNLKRGTCSWTANVELADGKTITDTVEASTAAIAIHEFRRAHHGCLSVSEPKRTEKPKVKRTKAKPATADLPLEEPAS